MVCFHVRQASRRSVEEIQYVIQVFIACLHWRQVQIQKTQVELFARNYWKKNSHRFPTNLPKFSDLQTNTAIDV